jgi:hypothetical protein
MLLFLSFSKGSIYYTYSKTNHIISTTEAQDGYLYDGALERRTGKSGATTVVELTR